MHRFAKTAPTTIPTARRTSRTLHPARLHRSPKGPRTLIHPLWRRTVWRRTAKPLPAAIAAILNRTTLSTTIERAIHPGCRLPLAKEVLRRSDASAARLHHRSI
jgi:hypothetical protein